MKDNKNYIILDLMIALFFLGFVYVGVNPESSLSIPIQILTNVYVVFFNFTAVVAIMLTMLITIYTRKKTPEEIADILLFRFSKEEILKKDLFNNKNKIEELNIFVIILMSLVAAYVAVHKMNDPMLGFYLAFPMVAINLSMITIQDNINIIKKEIEER